MHVEILSRILRLARLGDLSLGHGRNREHGDPLDPTDLGEERYDEYLC